MGYKLRREVRDLLPPDLLTASERVLLLEVADTCGDDTRAGWPGLKWLMDKCDVPTKKRVGEHLASIARKWFEIRVELGKDRHGKSFYAIPGKRMTFRLPTRGELVARHGEDKVPEIQGLYPCKAPENQGAKAPEFQGGTSPKTRDPSPQLEPLKENPSSLSSADLVAAASDPEDFTLEPEREIEESSSQPEPLTGVRKLIAKHGAVGDGQIDFCRGWIDSGHNVLGDGFYYAADRNGSLAGLVAEALTADRNEAGGGKPSWCGQCDERTRQRTVEGMENLTVSRCPDCHPLAVQERTDGQNPAFRRSTGALRAQQGLAVADELDRQNGHGAYAPGQIRSPADRRVAENQALFEHYRRQEDERKRRSNRHVPYRDPVDISAYETSHI